MSTQRIILGTAGHIDHGKTALVRSLTGIDTDRLKEEQRRGITIELGFAHLTLGEVRFGVVDVPGHERFIKSMVAGATGIDLVLLVVAADEGVMPQTREHLDICGLLGVELGLVALTKVDLVDPDWLALVTEDLRATLAPTFLAAAPIVPCSAVTGAGLEELRGALLELAGHARPRDAGGLLRLPLDRVFTMKGFGTVVTGTLLSGTLRQGEDVQILPGTVAGKVRGLQVHGEPVGEAVAGQRTAVNVGGVDRTAVARGEVLVHPDQLAASSMIVCVVHLLPSTRRPLPARAKVLFHIGTRQQEGTCVLLERSSLEGGGQALAQLRFDRPVVALPGDRFILRGFHKQENHGTTIGGGEVIHVLSRKIRARDDLSLFQRLRQAPPEERVALEILAAGPAGLHRAGLQQRLPLLPAEIDGHLLRLRQRGAIQLFDRDHGGVIHTDHAEALRLRLGAALDRFHRDHPLEPGMSREELRSRLGPAIEPRLFHLLLQSLEQRGEIVVERELCRRSSHTIQLTAQALHPLAERLLARYQHAALAPPREPELAAELAAEAKQIPAALKLLLEAGSLVRVGPLLFAREAIEDLRSRLVAFLEGEGQITPTQFKALVGQSRKFAIPLAEHFDAQKVTLRVGEIRKLRA